MFFGGIVKYLHSVINSDLNAYSFSQLLQPDSLRSYSKVVTGVSSSIATILEASSPPYSAELSLLVFLTCIYICYITAR